MLFRSEIKYHGSHLSDPVIIRTDGSMTYMLCSAIDDMDYNISHIIRGEDHVSNTAIQIQMFKAMDAKIPNFAHLSLIKSSSDKISKRIGGYDIESLRDEHHLENMAINSFLTFIGTSEIIHSCKTLDELVKLFDINTYSKSPTTYNKNELEDTNQKLVMSFEYHEIVNYLEKNNLNKINEQFWLAIRPNLKKLSELKDWWDICHAPQKVNGLDSSILEAAYNNLPENIDASTWSHWTKNISQITGKKGKELFMTLRLALTGKDNGPELSNLLLLLSRDEILTRLK